MFRGKKNKENKELDFREEEQPAKEEEVTGNEGLHEEEHQEEKAETVKEEEKYTILEAVTRIAPLLQKIIPIDCSIAVTNTEKFIADIAGEDDELTSNEGKSIPEESGIKKAMRSGEVQRYNLPKEIYGNPFKAASAPIKNEKGVIIGAMAIRMSTKNQEMLNETASTFASTYEEVVATTENLASSAQELANRMEDLTHSQAEMNSKVENMENVLSFIKSIADNSNLLGINAAIEAARVGEKGRGFEVVANEIRKMAENSSKSVENIKEEINTIKEQVATLDQEIAKISEISQQQASSSQEITASMEELIEHVQNIEKIANEL